LHCAGKREVTPERGNFCLPAVAAMNKKKELASVHTLEISCIFTPNVAESVFQTSCTFRAVDNILAPRSNFLWWQRLCSLASPLFA